MLDWNVDQKSSALDLITGIECTDEIHFILNFHENIVSEKAVAIDFTDILGLILIYK